MAIIPGVKVDYMLSPRIITIPVVGTPVDVSIADLQDTLQDIEDDEQDGIVYPRLRDCSGGQSLGAGRFVGYTMQLQNAQVMFEGQTTSESEGTSTADDPDGKILTDGTATFVADGVERGHKIVNWTSGASSVVTEVISPTQLRHVVLSGGTRATWETTDVYRIFPIIKCSVGEGNLTAVDALGNALDPIMPSPNVFAEKESATSAALVEGSGGVTAEECADAVWDEDMAVHSVAGSAGEYLTEDSSTAPTVEEVADAVWDEPAADHAAPGSIGRSAKDTYDTAIDTYNVAADIADLTDDLHDEALGKWSLNTSTSTLTLYRIDGSVLRVFTLKTAVGDVPPYVERAPA